MKRWMPLQAPLACSLFACSYTIMDYKLEQSFSLTLNQSTVNNLRSFTACRTGWKWTTICQGLGSPVASAASSRLLGRRQDVLKANACSSWTSDPTEPAKVSHPPIARPRLLVQFAYESAMSMASRVISSCLRTEGGHRTQHSIRFLSIMDSSVHPCSGFGGSAWFLYYGGC